MTAIDEGARPAAVADIEAIAEMAARASAEMSSLKGGSVWVRLEARRAPLRRGLIEDLHADASHLIAGTIDGVVVGYSAVRLVELHDGAVLGRVDDIYVLPEARGVGVGEAMMELVLDWAHGRGCVGVDSLALPGDRNTKNFFETHGLVARSITVHRALPVPADSEAAAGPAPSARPRQAAGPSLAAGSDTAA